MCHINGNHFKIEFFQIEREFSLNYICVIIVFVLLCYVWKTRANASYVYYNLPPLVLEFMHAHKAQGTHLQFVSPHIRLQHWTCLS